MELKIYNPTTESTIKAVDWNFDELKQEIVAKANDYKSLVYTDDNIKEAKADRANLNKFIKALEDKRKEVKKMMLAPYSQFEKQVKELVEIIDDANLNIDSQVKAYEQKKKDEKLDKVKNIYENTFCNSEFKDILTWDKVFKQSYLNVSTTQKTIINEMEDLRDRVAYDLGVINADIGEYQFEMKEAYLKNFSMSEALAAKQRFEENARKKAEYEARRKAEEEARINREKAEAEKMANAGSTSNITEVLDEDVQSEQSQTDVEVAEPVVENYVTIDFRVTGTAEQLNALKEFLKNNNINYGPVQ